MNSCSISRTGNLVASGSDDGFVKLWDPRVRRSVAEFMNQYQVTSVCLSRDDQQVMSGGIDNDVKVFDVRKLDLAYTMTGHNGTITGTCALAQLPCVCVCARTHACVPVVSLTEFFTRSKVCIIIFLQSRLMTLLTYPWFSTHEGLSQNLHACRLSQSYLSL